ncbi:MAG: hypothetical protein NC311_09675 [Muribaculaceae bacterium]|nr:hypothetical protein [Muribaculaceae bacterium]
MSHSNGVITRPVSLPNDVYPVLGISSSGGCSLTYACQNAHGKINKWSLKKPVDSESLFPVSGGVAEWWKGTSKDCNLNWSFDSSGYRPTVTFRSPNKNILGMFDGYNHNAVCGLAFKNGSISHNLLSETSMTVPLEDSASSVTIYDVKDCALFTGLKPGIRIDATGDNIPISMNFAGSWSGRSMSFTLAASSLELLGVGDFVAEFVLMNTSNLIVYYPFPSSTNQKCTISLIAETGITYAWSSPYNIYDPVKKGYYPVANYGRFSNPGLVIDSTSSIWGFVMSSAYLTQTANSPIEAASSENMYIVFEWDEYTNTGNKRYRVKCRLQTFANNTFSDFSIRKGGGRTGNFGIDYRYLPKFTNTTQCQFYLTYRKFVGGQERYYRIGDRYWLKLKCPIGQGTTQEM